MTVFERQKLIAAVSRAGGALLGLVASSTGVANAQVNCETIRAGPARTDCYIGLGRISRQKSDIAASTAQQNAESATYHQLTGRRSNAKRHRAVSTR
jgi:hypothetical protein